jgi:UDP-GlcNAc3NAcA epimerase
MKIVTVVGARPQFIKAAALSRALINVPTIEEVLIHTGQHYDENMSDVFFEELEIPRPDFHLGVGSGTQGCQTGRMLEAIERVLLDVKPDWVLVYGDTNSTLAGALAAVKLHIPVAHIEAGLRSFNRRMPEEHNRVLADHVSDLLFAPTAAADENLRREGIPQRMIHLVGDVMYDATLHYGEKAERGSRILERLDLKAEGYILATVHRAENTDDVTRLRAIFLGLELAAQQGLVVVVPLHPRTRATLQRARMLEKVSRSLRIVEPLGYLDMLMLEKHARLIATDSGGVQKEAFFYRVPCVTLRDETEWVELVELGWNCVVPPLSETQVFAAVQGGLGKSGLPSHPYGHGDAVEKIVTVLSGTCR